MHIGTQIQAPEGWFQMVKNETYHFLKSQAKPERVMLIHYSVAKKHKDTKAHLVVLPRSKFEDGLRSGFILPLETQSLLPPWLQGWGDFELSLIDSTRPKAIIPHSERVEDRVLKIAPAIRDLEVILSAADPEAEINRRAALCMPRQHETRFRLWFLTYICFGQDMWMLLPPFLNIGRYDRFAHPDTKFGAPSIAYGKTYGNGMSIELKEKCVSCFKKRAKLGKKFNHIYQDFMVLDLHCRTTVTEHGMRIYHSPDGHPFPTFWQFKYAVVKNLGIEYIQKKLYGAVRHRAEFAASKGSFTEEISNLMERVEFDGYYTKELPKGYVEGSSLPRLSCVVARDLLSGKKLGIGFSFGEERNSAYRAALFCMAVPKDFFCSLFGITLLEGEWLNEGLMGHISLDRGPGGRKKLVDDIQNQFPIKDMPPSWFGQSKATVESSHQKEVNIQGQPTYVQSDLTPVQLARREIAALIRYNNTSYMEGRFDPDSDLALVPSTPIGLWKHYDGLYRNDAMPMSIAEAVRTFLTPFQFSLKEDGVWLDKRKYYSDELAQTGILERVARSGEVGTKIDGYLLEMCIRHMWVEVDGELLMLTAKLRIRDDEEKTYMSLQELNQWTEARKIVRSEYSVHQHAGASEYIYRYKQDTGKLWDTTKRRAGRTKRDAIQKQEESEARQATSSRRRAS